MQASLMQILPGMRANAPAVQITSRRYLGNKARLLPFIARVVGAETCSIDSFADLFAGTGSVTSLFHDIQLVCNDILYSNHVCTSLRPGQDREHLRPLRRMAKERRSGEKSGSQAS